MKREEILTAITFLLKNLNQHIKDTKVTDDIGYKKVFSDLVPIGDFILANSSEIPDYELYSFMKLCSCAKDLRDPMREAELRHHEKGLIETMIDQERMTLRCLYGYGKEVIEEKPIEEAQPSVRIVSKPEPMQESNIIELGTYQVKEALEHLQNEMEHCSRQFVMNRSRLDKLGFSLREDEMYSLVAAWCGKATSLADRVMNGEASITPEYCTRYLRNVEVLTKMMIGTLEAMDATTLKERADALEANLMQMDTYYGEPAKKIN